MQKGGRSPAKAESLKGTVQEACPAAAWGQTMSGRVLPGCHPQAAVARGQCASQSACDDRAHQSVASEMHESGREVISGETVNCPNLRKPSQTSVLQVVRKCCGERGVACGIETEN